MYKSGSMTKQSQEDNLVKSLMPNNYSIVACSPSSANSYQQEKKPNSVFDRGIWNQILCTFACLVLAAACGVPIGYSAVLLPQLSTSYINKNYTPEIVIDLEMGSWIASVHSLATPVGSVISGPLADYVGRRNTLLISTIPTFIGWIILASAQSYPMLLTGRFLCGFATGVLGGPCQVYIAETAEPNIRSFLIGAPFISYSLGILMVYALGSTLHWRMVAWCGNILPALAGLAILFIPESPTWLLRHQRLPQALKALTFLRGDKILAQKELNEMNERFEKERASFNKNNENIFQLCCKRSAIKPLLLVSIFSFLQIISGTFIVVFYAVDIIAEFGAEFNIKTAAIWTALVRMLCTIILCIILLFIKRRRILILSGFVSGLSCLVLSIFLFMQKSQNIVNGTHIIVAGVCLVFYIAFNTPLMVMPSIMVGELFPARIRGRTAGSVFAAMNLTLFILAKAFPFIHLKIKMSGVFLMFSIASFLVSIFMFMFQPETKGCTLEQIEDYFSKSNWLWWRRDKIYKIIPNPEPKA